MKRRKKKKEQKELKRTAIEEPRSHMRKMFTARTPSIQTAEGESGRG